MAALGLAAIAERRLKSRFSVELDLRYRHRGRFPSVRGIGRTLNMSSSGILIQSDQRPPIGTRLEVILYWPWLLDGVTHLQLVAIGKVIRHGESSFALAFSKHEFRTMKPRSISACTPLLKSA